MRFCHNSDWHTGRFGFLSDLGCSSTEIKNSVGEVEDEKGSVGDGLPCYGGFEPGRICGR
jgi:hypothetical protein